MIVFGRPVTMSRPRISVVISSRQRRRRADLELHLLGGLLADQRACGACLQWLTIASSISSPPTRIDSRDDDPAERDHRDLAGAAADVDDHRARRLGDRQPGADRGRHRLLDQVGLAGAGRQAGLLDRALLDPGDAGGHADDDPRVGEAVLVHASG